MKEEMDLEDIKDQAKVVGKLTPREFAKLHGINAQLVYYYIRTKQISEERCACGRKVIDVAEAEEVFSKTKVLGQGLDTSPDHKRK